jgi:hypothetical protein
MGILSLKKHPKSLKTTLCLKPIRITAQPEPALRVTSSWASMMVSRVAFTLKSQYGAFLLVAVREKQVAVLIIDVKN